MFTLAVGAILTLVTSCDSGNDPEIDKASFGTVTIDRTGDVCTGQGVTYSVSLTTNGETSPSISWVDLSTGISYPNETTYANGIASIKFWWSSIGEHSAKCVYTYYYEGGYVSKDVTSSVLNVKAPHIGNSLIGNSLSQVTTDNTGLYKVQDDVYATIEQDGSIYNYFTFTSEILIQGEKLESKEAYKAAAGYNYLAVELNINNMTTLDLTSAVYGVFVKDGFDVSSVAGLADAIALFKTGENLTSLDEGVLLSEQVDEGNITLAAQANMIDNSNVTRTISVYRDMNDLTKYIYKVESTTK